MASKSPVDRIVALLADQAPERRLAAIIVLGELRAKQASPGLARALEEEAPALQRHALDALTRIGVTKTSVKAIWPLLASRDSEVRASAAAAIASLGDRVVPEVRRQLSEAEGDARRAYESILSRLGGREAFDALLEALEAGDVESNRATALELRSHVRDANAATRRSYRGRLEKFLKRLAKDKDKRPSAMAAGVKVLGFLEDPKTSDTLLAWAKNAKLHPTVRQEALIGLRFTMGKKVSAPVIKALVAAASAPDRALAQTALMTIAALDLPESLAPAISELALHPEIERARMAIDKLSSQKGAKATETLVDIIARGDKRRAELAADALEPRRDATKPLAKLLAQISEPERAKLVRRALDPRAGELTAAQCKAILDGALKRLIAGEDAWRSGLGLVAARNARKVAERLREESVKLRRQKKLESEMRLLRALLEHTQGEGRDEDRYRLASIELASSPLDPRARRADRAIGLLARLQRGGYDVAKALRADRSAGLEELYYVGFCFLEDDVDGGEDLLEHVVKKGGRKKIAKAAKNKLKLVG